MNSCNHHKNRETAGNNLRIIWHFCLQFQWFLILSYYSLYPGHRFIIVSLFLFSEYRNWLIYGFRYQNYKIYSQDWFSYLPCVIYCIIISIKFYEHIRYFKISSMTYGLVKTLFANMPMLRHILAILKLIFSLLFLWPGNIFFIHSCLLVYYDFWCYCCFADPGYWLLNN